MDAAFDLGLLQNQRLRRLMLRAEARILKSFDRVSTISPQMLRRLKDKGLPQEKVRRFETGSIPAHHLGSLPRSTSGLSSKLAKTTSSPSTQDDVEQAGARPRRGGGVGSGGKSPQHSFYSGRRGPHKPKLMEMSQGRGNIHFLGVQPNDRFAALMATADIHLIPQRAEAADLVLPSKLGAIFLLGAAGYRYGGIGDRAGRRSGRRRFGRPASDANALAEAVQTLGEDGLASTCPGKQGRGARTWNVGTGKGIIHQWLREMLSIDDDSVRLQSGGGKQLQPEALLLPVKEQVRVTGE